jgi:uncharacterized protein (TIGR02466 family)
MALHTELWFPSVVWSGILPGPDNARLKEYAYQRQKQDIGVEIHNYGGYQSTSIEQGESSTIDLLMAEISKEANSCAQQVGLGELELNDVWLNINGKGAYNHLHNQPTAVLTGVYYVDATDQQGNLQIERSDNAEYCLPEFPDKNTYFTSTRATYKAHTGAVYIFPAWTKHSVQGNKINKDRISISFNYGVKNNAD